MTPVLYLQFIDGRRAPMGPRTAALLRGHGHLTDDSYHAFRRTTGAWREFQRSGEHAGAPLYVEQAVIGRRAG